MRVHVERKNTIHEAVIKIVDKTKHITSPVVYSSSAVTAPKLGLVEHFSWSLTALALRQKRHVWSVWSGRCCAVCVAFAVE